MVRKASSGHYCPEQVTSYSISTGQFLRSVLASTGYAIGSQRSSQSTRSSGSFVRQSSWGAHGSIISIYIDSLTIEQMPLSRSSTQKDISWFPTNPSCKVSTVMIHLFSSFDSQMEKKVSSGHSCQSQVTIKLTFAGHSLRNFCASISRVFGLAPSSYVI